MWGPKLCPHSLLPCLSGFEIPALVSYMIYNRYTRIPD